MEQEQELLETLFESAPMGLAIIDPQFRLMRFNPTWADYIDRYTPSNSTQVKQGISLFDLEPGTEHVLRDLFAPVLAGKTVRREGIRLESGGIVSYWDIMLHPLLHDGRVTAMLDVSLDATDRELARERLEERVAQRTAEVERRRRMAESLVDIIRVINSARPLPQILNHIVDQARILSSAQVCVLHHINYAQATVAIEASSGLPEDVADISGFPLFSSRSDEIILERRPVFIVKLPEYDARPSMTKDNTGLHPAVSRWRNVMGQKYKAFLAIPLVVQGEVYGSLAFYFEEPRHFEDEEIALIKSLGDQASLAIDNAQLRIRAAETAVADERDRLARELHDAVTQTLFSASLIAEVLPRLWSRDPAQAAARLEELRELTGGALAEMRTLLLELRPAALTESSLSELLSQLASSVTGRARLPITVDVAGSRPLPPDVQVALYRIAQESLNNVIKHTDATEVGMRLCFNDDSVELTIRDNGCGFVPANVDPNSLGIGIMRERAARIGAELVIDSVPEVGTTIHVMSPLPQATQETNNG